jgi:hypothetical protein
MPVPSVQDGTCEYVSQATSPVAFPFVLGSSLYWNQGQSLHYTRNTCTKGRRHIPIAVCFPCRESTLEKETVPAIDRLVTVTKDC